MKTIKSVILPRARKVMLGNFPSLHPSLKLIQGFDENGQRLWYSQTKVGGRTTSHSFPVEWDLSGININLKHVWQGAPGTISLPGNMQIDPAIRIILPLYFTDVVNVPVPAPPAELLPIPVNLNTASWEELWRLPLGGLRNKHNLTSIIHAKTFNNIEELKDIVGKVHYRNCLLVGIII